MQSDQIRPKSRKMSIRYNLLSCYARGYHVVGDQCRAICITANNTETATLHALSRRDLGDSIHVAQKVTSKG